jgi:hypothetical protein
MVYEQKKRVKYADYQAGMYYISPADLIVNGKPATRQSEKNGGRADSGKAGCLAQGVRGKSQDKMEDGL